MPNKVIEKTFLETYQMHSDSIFKFVLFKIDNRERALDLSQDTFMKTWIHIQKNGYPQNIRAFLYKVAANLIIDEYRKRGKKDYNTDSLESMSEGGFEPSNDISEIESMTNRLDGEKLMELTKSLPETFSTVLYMKYNEELTLSEIAESLNVSQNVVSVRLNRAIKKMKEIVDLEIKKHEK